MTDGAVMFDVSHPAHVHLFKHAIAELQAEGVETLVTSRRKEVTTDLLAAAGIEHRPLSAKGDSKLALLTEWGVRELRLLRIIRAFEPDVVVSHFNPAAVLAARLTGTPSLVCTDDESFSPLLARPTYRFATTIATPMGFRDDLGDGQVSYDGLHELAYLHPDRFSFDGDRLRRHGVDPTDRFFVLRFVSWGAHHDVGQSGFSHRGQRDIVESLSAHGTVYVSREGDGVPDCGGEPLPVAPEDVHHLLAAADLFAGDSQTMALEAAVLGTPSVRSNAFAAGETLGHFAHLEGEYDLVRSFGDERAAREAIERLATDETAGDRWQRRREDFLTDAVDVTAFLLERIYRHTPGDGPSDRQRDAIART
jgi:predicted glycosyltransferase